MIFFDLRIEEDNVGKSSSLCQLLLTTQALVGVCTERDAVKRVHDVTDGWFLCRFYSIQSIISLFVLC